MADNNMNTMGEEREEKFDRMSDDFDTIFTDGTIGMTYDTSNVGRGK